MAATILVVDDEESVRESIKMILGDSYNIITASDGKQAIEKLLNESIDIMLLDIRMPGISGLEVLKQVEKVTKDIEVIIITAHKEVDVAVDALRLGAYHYITKPFNADELLSQIQNLLEKKNIVRENILLRSKISKATSLGEVIGQTEEMKKVIIDINKAIQSDDAVVIFGETGTEKELIAYTIHQQSARGSGNFISFTCTGKSAFQLECELFGWEKEKGDSSFEKQNGLLELASNGVLYINELGNMPARIQEKLLQTLQTRKFKRVNGKHDFTVDIRIISSSSKPLRRLVAQGHFNEELYHYVHVIPIDIPPLRQRKKDLPLLVDTLIQRHNKELGYAVEGIAEEALLVLSAYDWLGNIAELECLIENMVIKIKKGLIEIYNLPIDILLVGQEYIKDKKHFSLGQLTDNFKKHVVKKIVEENQENLILSALQLKIDVEEIEEILDTHE